MPGAGGLLDSSRRCGTGEVRRAPHAAGHRGYGARQLGAPQGFRPKGAPKAAAPPTARPRSDPGRLRRATPWPPISPRLAAPASRGSRPGRQARRAEGAPLKL